MKIKFNVLVIIFMLLIFTPSFAQTVEGKTIRLENYTGEVIVTTGAENSIKLINKMRLFDGYTITTAKDATAYLSIDNMKSIRLDQNTKVSIVKKDKINEIQILSGSIFFSVKEKLKDDETLDIVTPTMAIGIRGTSGTVMVKKDGCSLQVYSGKVVVKNKRGKEKVIQPGQEVYDSEINKKDLEVKELNKNGEEIPSFALNEINKDKEVKKQIDNEKVFEIEKFPKIEKDNNKKEEIERKEELRIIEKRKQEAKDKKSKNKIEITKEKIILIKEETKEENKDLEKQFERLTKGEKVEFEDLEGDIYIFEVDEKTGTAELKKVVEFSENVKIENTDKGTIKIFDGERNNTIDGKDFEGGYKVVD